jgi:hypothetical protein
VKPVLGAAAVALLAAGLLVVFAHHGGKEAPPAPTPSRAARLAWLQAWGTWQARMAKALTRGAPSQALVHSCGGLDRVPQAPDYFEPVATQSRKVCDRLRDGARPARAALAQALATLRPLLVQNQPLPQETGVVDASRIEPNLTAALRALVGTDLTVRCFDDADWHYVLDERSPMYGLPETTYWEFSDGGNVFVSQTLCHDLAVFVYGKKRQQLPYDQAVDLHQLAYMAEAVKDPQATLPVLSCRAMQDLADLTFQLGGSQREGRALAAVYWREAYGSQQAAYLSPACRPKGPLDETPKDGGWPFAAPVAPPSTVTTAPAPSASAEKAAWLAQWHAWAHDMAGDVAYLQAHFDAESTSDFAGVEARISPFLTCEDDYDIRVPGPPAGLLDIAAASHRVCPLLLAAEKIAQDVLEGSDDELPAFHRALDRAAAALTALIAKASRR